MENIMQWLEIVIFTSSTDIGMGNNIEWNGNVVQKVEIVYQKFIIVNNIEHIKDLDACPY